MNGKDLIIHLHDGGCDGYTIGKDFFNYKVTGNGLVLMNEDGAWIAWYNLQDVQKWHIE